MVLAGWLRILRAERFVVLADAAIWPGAQDGSTMRSLPRESFQKLDMLDLDRYLGVFDADLEAMPPEDVLGRVQRFLAVDLREVLPDRTGDCCLGILTAADPAVTIWATAGAVMTTTLWRRNPPRERRSVMWSQRKKVLL